MILSREDQREVKFLWLEKCWTMKEIADWFGVDAPVIYRCVKKIHIDEEEFQQKEAVFAEILNNCHNRKSILDTVTKQKKRLEKAYYDTSRFTRQNS